MASRQGFVSMLWPAALQASKVTGIDPRIIVAQAAQETRWGRKAPGNNYFGIKSHGKGGGQTFTTHEVVNGKRVKIKDSFRKFDSPAESVMGYAEFMTSNPRYRPMRQAQGLDAQIQALGKSGYATDPNYAQSVRNIALSLPEPSPSFTGPVPSDQLPISAGQTLGSQGGQAKGGMMHNLAMADQPQGPALGSVTPPFGQDPFGSMSPSGADTMMAGGGSATSPFSIDPAAASIAYGSNKPQKTTGQKIGSLLAGLGEAFAAPPPPRTGRMPDARAGGNPLAEMLANPTIAQILLSRRMG